MIQFDLIFETKWLETDHQLAAKYHDSCGFKNWLGFTLTTVAQGSTWTGKDIANDCMEHNFSVEKIQEVKEKRLRWESGHAIGCIFKIWIWQSDNLSIFVVLNWGRIVQIVSWNMFNEGKKFLKMSNLWIRHPPDLQSQDLWRFLVPTARKLAELLLVTGPASCFLMKPLRSEDSPKPKRWWISPHPLVEKPVGCLRECQKSSSYSHLKTPSSFGIFLGCSMILPNFEESEPLLIVQAGLWTFQTWWNLQTLFHLHSRPKWHAVPARSCFTWQLRLYSWILVWKGRILCNVGTKCYAKSVATFDFMDFIDFMIFHGCHAQKSVARLFVMSWRLFQP